MGELDGFCAHTLKVIGIAEGQEGFRLLDTLLHETLHSCCPYLSENEVAETANALTEVYRKVYGEPPIQRSHAGVDSTQGV